MTCRITNNKSIDEAIGLLCEQGFEGLGDAVTLLINHAMAIERAQHLRAEPYERTEKRQGHANGFKSKALKTRLGQLDLSVSQVRDSSFYPNSLERGMRSERVLKLAVAEMYVQGVATRNVKKITE